VADRRQRVTIQTIADAVGVHRSTVSRALGTDSRRISPQMVERVRSVARGLGYEPDPWARSLRTNRTMTLGLLIPRLSDVVLAVMFEKAQERARYHGYQAVTVSSHDDPQEQEKLLDHLLERRIDGLVLATVRLEDPILERLDANGMPYVLLNRTSGDRLCVRGDDELGGYLATRHLISQGHRRIGAVAGPLTVSTSIYRLNGFRRAHVEAGIDIDEDLVVASSLDAEGGLGGGWKLLSRQDPPTAIFAVNDITALGVMAVARDLGVAIPDDLAIVGYNDSTVAALLPTPLSSVSLPLEELGATAIDLLLGRIREEDCSSVVFTPHLVTRRSTDLTETR
jgi:LacI family transcriptional regulator